MRRRGMLAGVVPAVALLGVLSITEAQPPRMAPAMLEASERAGRELAVQTHPIEITAATELEAAFGAARRDGAGAIHVLPSPYFNVQRRALVDLAARYRLPAVYPPSVLTRASQLIE